MLDIMVSMMRAEGVAAGYMVEVTRRPQHCQARSIDSCLPSGGVSLPSGSETCRQKSNPGDGDGYGGVGDVDMAVVTAARGRSTIRDG